MPIPAPVLTGPPPPPPPPPVVPPPEVPPHPSFLSPAVFLETESGERLRLQGTHGVSLAPGMRGVGMGPVELETVPLPDRDGSVPISLRLGENEVFVPVVILADHSTDLRERRRALERMLDPKRGIVKILIQQQDTAEQRHTYGYYVDGMRGAYGRDEAGHDWQKLGLVFRCPDPAWYGTTVVREFTVDAATKPFLSPTVAFFPVILGASTVAGQVKLNNPGDYEAWPVWTVTGPAPSGLTLANTTTGKTFELTAAIAGGATATIDTRRAVQDVFNAGGDLWASVTQPVLWPLVPGDNDVSVTVTGATSSTKVRVEYDPPLRSGH